MRGRTRMRFFLVPLAAAVLTISGDSLYDAGASAPARPLVILVHGRGQLGFDSAATRREWKRDLDSSLALVGLPRLRDENVRLAWYADVLDPESTEECGTTDEAGAEELGLGAFARGFFASLTSALSESDDTRGARGLFGDILYFIDPAMRCAAERRVAGAIEAAAGEGRPVIVIAYSLGSLVAYQYLTSRAPRAVRPTELRLITVGSPLGMREIRELLMHRVGDSLRVPPGVKGWENIYDPDDLFSAPLAGKVGGTGIRDYPTHKASVETAHHVGRYLRDRSTGAALARALCATTREQLVGCDSL
jgi:hypothetical protein